VGAGRTTQAARQQRPGPRDQWMNLARRVKNKLQSIQLPDPDPARFASLESEDELVERFGIGGRYWNEA
jgi:hypothetical protein